MMTAQTPKEAPQMPAWIKDAKRRGEAIVKESERQRRQTSHSKETATVDRKVTVVLDC